MMNSDDWVMGWDIGGAHVKAALLCGGRAVAAQQWPCPLWQGMHHLDRAIRDAQSWAAQWCERPAMHALTMTGELVDLFASRAEGVKAIIDGISGQLQPLQVFAGKKGFMDAAYAIEQHEAVASANWLATACALKSRLERAQQGTILLDIGSTTTDIIALTSQAVLAQGSNDFTRLAHDELLYTGCTRTPLMALAQRVRFEGQDVNVMAEYFATTADVYRLMGELDEGCDQHAAADNGEKTALGSARRIARMIGRDVQTASLSAWRDLAAQFAGMQRELIKASLSRVLTHAQAIEAEAFKLPNMVLTGSGAFIGARVASELELAHETLSSRLGLIGLEAADTCAPAIAVALLLGDSSV